MIYIQDISVDIRRGSKALARKGFGMPLILGDGAPDATGTSHTIQTHKEYSDMKAVAVDYTDETNEYKMAAAMFCQGPSPKVVAIYSKADTETITQALDTINSTHSGFYAILIAERTAAAMAKAGDWANANQKFFFGCTSDEGALTDRNVDREAYLIHDAPNDFPECAWAGQNLPKDPGSITWKWKSLNGQVAAASFDITKLNTIRKNNGQTITEIGGISVVNEGKTTSGEFIDVIRGQDWVKARIEEGLYRLFISNEKVSMDTVGIAQVESVIRSVLQQAGNAGIIARAGSESELNQSDDKVFMFQVTVPRREDIVPDDRAARILPDIGFIYHLAGAIHEAKVEGRIVA
jgi:hypothetical protein